VAYVVRLEPGEGGAGRSAGELEGLEKEPTAKDAAVVKILNAATSTK
jgi:hypothetical protein